MATTTQLFDWIDARRDELLTLLSDLIDANSENPPGDEAEAAAVVARFFDRHGIPHASFECEPRRTNIIGRIGQGGPSLIAAGHLDVVPAGDGWTRPPFQATCEGDRIYGRGALDDKGLTAAVLVAAACVKACAPLKGTLLVAGVADEEQGSAKGVRYLLDEGILKADMALVPDNVGGLETISIAERGRMVLRVTSFGKQAHGSTPHRGVNAIWPLLSALNSIRERGTPQGKHPLLADPTLNLGQIHGGAAPNVVPARATATLDIRFLPGQSSQAIIAVIDDLLRETETRFPGARFEMETVMNNPAAEVGVDHPLVGILERTTEEVVGRKAQPRGIDAGTVFKFFVHAGIPAVGFGVGDATLAHMADEYVGMEELMTYTRVLALTFCRALGAEAI